MKQDDKNESIATEIIREQKQKIKKYKVLCTILVVVLVAVVTISHLKGGI
jgi:hypothetical protein